MDNNLKEIIGELESSLEGMTEKERGVALEFIAKSRRELARDDFYMFLRLIAPEIIPPPFVNGKHLYLYCNELERVEKGVGKNKEKLQLFLPPGSMKTVTLCIFVAWVLGRHPDWYILHIGHTLEFARDNFGQRIRDILAMEDYQQIFPDTRLSRTTRRKESWKTTSGGHYVCAGAGNQIAGKRAHISICDDVLSEQTARSKLERQKINEWYVPGLRSRLMPGGCEIIVNTRWHLDDLSGSIIKRDADAKQKDWRIIAIPAILEGELGEHAAHLLELPVGGSFWPEFWPLDSIEEKKATNTPQMWNALYMQNPVADDGNIFKKNHFMKWNTLEKGGFPKFSYVIISFDTAFSTKTSADYSAFGVWGVFTDEKERITGVMLIEADRGHWSYPELVSKIQEMYAKHRAKYIIIESKASGQSLLQDLVLYGLPVYAYSPDKRGDKEERANACVPFLEAGMIWVPEGASWVDEFLTELYSFPAGPNDDQVDQFTQAILWMRDANRLRLDSYGTIRRNLTEEELEDQQAMGPPKTKPSYWKATLPTSWRRH